ncbi:MAG TPA: 5-formyltetrahydrofolate cyclo-ligase [Jiangellales bacterium]|nr:5-formyltetrahydrofolate cyclo-ligase [Jiangellales bacterium]
MPRGPLEDVPGAKDALRRRLLEARRGLRPAELAAGARAVCDGLLGTPEVAGARVVGAYVSVGQEPGTGPLLDALLDRGTEVLLPVLLPDGDLDWAVHEGDAALRPATRGLLEPAGPRLGPGAVTRAGAVLVPGLAVDRRGVRLGRGGGSYDRALARVAGRAFTCVLLHDGEVLDLPVPRDRHDVPVAAAVTPGGVLRFR